MTCRCMVVWSCGLEFRRVVQVILVLGMLCRLLVTVLGTLLCMRLLVFITRGMMMVCGAARLVRMFVRVLLTEGLMSLMQVVMAGMLISRCCMWLMSVA